MTYVYAVLVGCLLMTVSFIGGCHYNQEQVEVKAASIRAQDLQIALKMEPNLERTITLNHTKTVTLTKQVTTYVDRYVPSPGAASVSRPVYYLTFGAVSLWNASLSPSTPGDPSENPPGSNSLDLSPISFDQAETNALLNFGQYQDCRTVVQGWQDWYKSVAKVRP